MNRQDLFKNVPNYMGKTKHGKCMAGFNARLGGGVSIAKGETESEILKNYKEKKKRTLHEWLESFPPNLSKLALENSGEEPDEMSCKYKSADSALLAAFTWSETPQGHKFWSDIHDTLEEKESLAVFESKAASYLKIKKYL